MRTFTVSDVVRAVDPLPAVDARVALEKLAGRSVEALYRTTKTLVQAWTWRAVEGDGARASKELVPFHPFVAAVHYAFDDHRPLVLSPDAVWLMIAQGFAFHVQANAEALRSRVVAHQGRELIVVYRDEFLRGDPANDWPGVFTELSSAVAARTGPLHALVLADFSTTTPTARAASEVTLLATAQSYFAFQVHTRCGIPEITLTGTSEDWRAIRARVEELRAYDAGPWIDALAPVLDQFVAAERGDVDAVFWSSFYKLNDASGGPYVTGWINVLLPYVLDRRGAMVPNRNVGSWEDGLSAHFGGGPTTENLPSGLARVPFLWKYIGTELRMSFLGGSRALPRIRRPSRSARRSAGPSARRRTDRKRTRAVSAARTDGPPDPNRTDPG